MKTNRPFLTARWRFLAMLNYWVDPAILSPFLPYGTELDKFNGQTYASMVGFMFLDTRVKGIAVPFHTDFEEVNLRFYVRRKGVDGWRRGVVFVKEIVPRLAIASLARFRYGEKYIALPMQHRLDLPEGETSRTGSVEYLWRLEGRWNSLKVYIHGIPQPAAPDSEEEFITEHYWGYSRLKDGGSIEYQVEHPSWLVWQVSQTSLDCDIARLYGPQFVDCLNTRPSSAFVATGSPVTVYEGSRLD